MTVWTVLGCASVIAASAGMGMQYTSRLRTRINGVRRLLDLVRHIAVHIEVYRAPLTDIYAAYDGNRKLSEALTEKGFLAAVTEAGLMGGDRERRLAAELDGCLGPGTVQDSVRCLRYVEEELAALAHGLEESLPEKERVSRAVSILAGASAVILLI